MLSPIPLHLQHRFAEQTFKIYVTMKKNFLFVILLVLLFGCSPGIYIDENVMRMCYTHRRIFTQLVGQLIKEGKKDKALAALDYAEKMIPSYNVPYDWANGAFQMAESYYQLGQNEKANKIIDELANKSLEYMIWYLSLNDNQLAIAGENFVYNASLLDAEVRLMEKYKSEELAKHYSTQLDQLYNEYVTRMKGK